MPSHREVRTQIDRVIRDLAEQAKNPELVEQKWRATQERVAQPVSPVGVDYATTAPTGGLS